MMDAKHARREIGVATEWKEVVRHISPREMLGCEYTASLPARWRRRRTASRPSTMLLGERGHDIKLRAKTAILK